MKSNRKYLIAAIAVAVEAVLFIYSRFVRPWQLRWGSTAEEYARPMPGDDIVENPTFNATRAITINASPEAIWPWLLQIGTTRAGFYSYDWIDNAGVHSSEQILPGLQHMDIDDFIPMTPDRKNGMWVMDIEDPKYMIWTDNRDTSTWLWLLSPIDAGTTRLISRLRVRYKWTPPWIFYYLLQEVGDIVMMRKCLLGIKERAEKLQHEMDKSADRLPADHALRKNSARKEALVH